MAPKSQPPPSEPPRAAWRGAALATGAILVGLLYRKNKGISLAAGVAAAASLGALSRQQGTGPSGEGEALPGDAQATAPPPSEPLVGSSSAAGIESVPPDSTAETNAILESDPSSHLPHSSLSSLNFAPAPINYHGMDDYPIGPLIWEQDYDVISYSDAEGPTVWYGLQDADTNVSTPSVVPAVAQAGVEEAFSCEALHGPFIGEDPTASLREPIVEDQSSLNEPTHVLPSVPAVNPQVEHALLRPLDRGVQIGMGETLLRIQPKSGNADGPKVKDGGKGQLHAKPPTSVFPFVRQSDHEPAIGLPVKHRSVEPLAPACVVHLVPGARRSHRVRNWLMTALVLITLALLALSGLLGETAWLRELRSSLSSAYLPAPSVPAQDEQGVKAENTAQLKVRQTGSAVRVD